MDNFNRLGRNRGLMTVHSVAEGRVRFLCPVANKQNILECITICYFVRRVYYFFVDLDKPVLKAM